MSGLTDVYARRAGTRFERHARATNTCRLACHAGIFRRRGRLEQRINANIPRKPFSWAFAGRLRTGCLYFHLILSTLNYALKVLFLRLLQICAPPIRNISAQFHNFNFCL